MKKFIFIFFKLLLIAMIFLNISKATDNNSNISFSEWNAEFVRSSGYNNLMFESFKPNVSENSINSEVNKKIEAEAFIDPQIKGPDTIQSCWPLGFVYAYIGTVVPDSVHWSINCQLTDLSSVNNRSANILEDTLYYFPVIVCADSTIVLDSCILTLTTYNPDAVYTKTIYIKPPPLFGPVSSFTGPDDICEDGTATWHYNVPCGCHPLTFLWIPIAPPVPPVGVVIANGPNFWNGPNLELTGVRPGFLMLTLRVTDNITGIWAVSNMLIEVKAAPIGNKIGAPGFIVPAIHDVFPFTKNDYKWIPDPGPPPEDPADFTYWWTVTGNATIFGVATNQTVTVQAGRRGDFQVILKVLSRLTACERTITTFCQIIDPVINGPEIVYFWTNNILYDVVPANLNTSVMPNLIINFPLPYNKEGNFAFGLVNPPQGQKFNSLGEGFASISATITGSTPSFGAGVHPFELILHKDIRIIADFNFEIVGESVVCENDVYTYECINLIPPSPPRNYNYQWSIVGNAVAFNPPDPNPAKFKVKAGLASLGGYSVILKVTDLAFPLLDHTSTKIFPAEPPNMVTVLPKPSGAIGRPQDSYSNVVCELDQDIFTCILDTGITSIDTYLWSVTGNGNIIGPSNLQNVNIQAGNAQGGGYTVNLQVTSLNGCMSEVMKQVNIFPKPHFTIIGPPGHTLEVNEVASFSATDSTPGDVYSWAITGNQSGAFTIGSTTGFSVLVNAGPSPGRFFINCTETLGECDSSVAGGVTVTDPSPVEMMSFSSSIMRDKITLNWQTASELNNSGFDIERSALKGQEPLNWGKIGFVQGHGTVTASMDYSYEDSRLMPGKYKYRLKQIDFNNNFEYFDLNEEVEVGTPDKFTLSQNYPNPFNPNTKIDFDLPNDAYTTMKIYDNSGKLITTLINEIKQAGYYTIEFNASNLSSGIYFYRIESGSFIATKKMVVIK